jgi:uncharacterized RDD family membrane protein YckC
MTPDAAEADRARFNEQLGLPALVLLAPMWRRVIAQLLDQLIVVVPVAIVALSLGVGSVDELADNAFALNVGVVVSAFLYEFVMIGRWGRTVGKFAMDTRVVRVDTAGPILWYSSAIRALVPLAAGVIPGIGSAASMIVYVTAFFDRRRQGWHDRAAGTIVVMHSTP